MRPGLVLLLACVTPATARAQLGELHFGLIAGYGAPESYRSGAGVTVAAVPGRLFYMGLRYVHHWGSTTETSDGSTPVQYETTSSVITADLGVDIPVGPAELVAGASIGTTRFHQLGQRLGVAGVAGEPFTETAWEFTVSPTVTVYFRAGRILVAPELSWSLAGDPDFVMHASHRGPIFYLKLVVPFEVDRIRQ